MNPPRTEPRQSADERRTTLLAVAMEEFAAHGFAGGSTERIAAQAGISQPYLFRLFGTKKQLFIAMLERCLDETLEMFKTAAGELKGAEAMAAMGEAYGEWIRTDATRLQCQLTGYAACADDDVRAVMRAGYGRLVTYVETVTGADQATVAAFFASGMLFNVLNAMDLHQDPTDWAGRLVDGCTSNKDWLEEQ